MGYDRELRARVIKEVEETGNVAAVANRHQISRKTVHNWLRKRSKKVDSSDQTKLKELRKQLADARLEVEILKELVKKTNQVWLKD